MPGRSHRSMLVAAAVCAAAAAGCSASGSHNAATFDDQQSKHLSCMAHQGRMPSALYRLGSHEDTTATLRMLAYYTANGGKPYCDGRGPTSTDRTWARLYVRLGADATHVAAIAR